MEVQRGIFSVQVKNDLRTVGVGSFRHAAEKIRDTGLHQFCDSLGQLLFQRHAPAVRFIISPRKFTGTVAGERASSVHHNLCLLITYNYMYYT